MLGKCVYILVQSKISIVKTCADTVQVLGKCIYVPCAIEEGEDEEDSCQRLTKDYTHMSP